MSGKYGYRTSVLKVDGLLGIDFGYGLDGVNDNDLKPNGWETHFVIGQNF